LSLVVQTLMLRTLAPALSRREDCAR